MLKLKKVAITGGISSGKSLAGQYFSDLGASVVDADEIVHHLLTPQTDLGRKVIELLGDGIVANGKIERARVAKMVFNHPKLLRSLEELIHPLVYEGIEKQYRDIAHQENPPPLFLAEVPLLFESGGESYFDTTIAVVAPTEKCWERYRQSTGHEREDFSRRRARQLRQSEKAERADFVIHNDGTSEELQQKVAELFDHLCGAKANKLKEK